MVTCCVAQASKTAAATAIQFWTLSSTPLHQISLKPFAVQLFSHAKAARLLPLSTDLHFLDISDWWSYAFWNLSCLAAFILHNVFEAPPRGSMCQGYPIVLRYRLCLCLQQWMDVWLISRLGQLWIMLLWTLVCKSLYLGFHFFEVLRSGIAVLSGIFMFNCLRRHQTLL